MTNSFDIPTDSRPDATVSVRDLFGIDTELEVPAFSTTNDLVPTVDQRYRFDKSTTLALLAGFAHNSRVLVQGMHGTGKSTHIEQVAARLRWPCVRLNLDGHVSRLDLLGRDAVTLRAGLQVTEFREGLLPWAMQRPVALILDEYDAGRADVLFVLQQLLEPEGKLTLLDGNRILRPHPAFRLFATANTVGLGDRSGLYHGVGTINQAQLDRWTVVAALNFLPREEEIAIVMAKAPTLAASTAAAMVDVAALTREGFAAGDLSTLMSPRTVMTWAQNLALFGDLTLAFQLTFLNKCDPDEHPLVVEYFQRCFDLDMGATTELVA